MLADLQNVMIYLKTTEIFFF